MVDRECLRVVASTKTYNFLPVYIPYFQDTSRVYMEYFKTKHFIDV
jgi:hypothetical protein